MILGISQSVSKSILDEVTLHNIRYFHDRNSITIEFWDSGNNSLKKDFSIPSFYKGEIFFAGLETGKLSIVPYGESQIICSIKGTKLRSKYRNKTHYYCISNDKTIASITCSTTAGGCEITIYEFYLGHRTNNYYVTYKKILSVTIDEFIPEKFGKYKHAVEAAITRSKCEKCEHLHFGELK
jgi:hypothetical protein